MRGLNAVEVTEMLREVSEGVIARTDLLTQVDKAIGDGDHGIGMARGFEAVLARLGDSPPVAIDVLLAAVGSTLMGSIGGASGAVFGTLFGEGGKALKGRELFGAEELSLFLSQGLEAVKKRGKAQPGDKTMVDALEPAALESGKHVQSPLDEALAAVSLAAQRGMEGTKAMVARMGKARTLGERSIGHADPGATSMSIILELMRTYVQRRGMNAVGLIMERAWAAGIVIPAFNIPYLPMMEPVIRALRAAGSFGLVAVARPDWEKFEAKSLRAVFELYQELKDEAVTGIHLDHVPVIDEDGRRIEYEPLIAEAIDLGYDSVMIDGSRLDVSENIDATRKVVEMAHARGIPVEAELGAVFGHEEGPLPSYEELFASGRGFTDPAEAKLFAEATGVDWLSVAIGNVHGAVSMAARDQKKLEARLNIDRLAEIRNAAGRPLVLHGGSGIRKESLREAFAHGIAKINIGTAVRHAYENGMKHSGEQAVDDVYRATLTLLTEELGIGGSAEVLR
jgi:dihydroxyacetone kinase phosphoprotein-dependent L subunit